MHRRVELIEKVRLKRSKDQAHSKRSRDHFLFKNWRPIKTHNRSL